MSERCTDCGHAVGASEDRCGAALERLLGAEPNQQYRALCKLRSRITKLEAVAEAADAMSELLRGYDYSDGSLAGKLLAAYDAAKAELEMMKADV